MANESGIWIMYGVDWDDPECIHTVDEAIEYINEVGFLPFLKMKSMAFHWRKELYPSIGCARIRQQILGFGEKSQPVVATETGEKGFEIKKINFQMYKIKH